MKLFRGKKIAGGTASRAEVYGLFIAAIVIIGGGVSGAIAITQSSGTQEPPSHSGEPLNSSPHTQNDSVIETNKPSSSSTPDANGNQIVKSTKQVPNDTNNTNVEVRDSSNRTSNPGNTPETPSCAFTAGQLASAQAELVRLGGIRTSTLRAIADAEGTIRGFQNYDIPDVQRQIISSQSQLETAINNGDSSGLPDQIRRSIERYNQRISEINGYISSWQSELTTYRTRLNSVEAAIASLPRC